MAQHLETKAYLESWIPGENDNDEEGDEEDDD